MPLTSNHGVTISWEATGDRSAPPLLLIMGHVFGSAMWHRSVAELAGSHRVITYDNWGIGASGCPPEPHTIQRMVADARVVLRAAGVDRAHVFGVSMGGLVAQELALAHPDQVGALVLGCTGAPSNTTAPKRSPKILYHLPRSAYYRMNRARMYGPAATQSEIDEDMEILRSTPVDIAGLKAQARAIESYRSHDRITEISVPTLVVHGDADRVVPLQRGLDLADRIPGADLLVVPATGHNLTAGHTRLVNQAVVEFLARHRFPSKGATYATR